MSVLSFWHRYNGRVLFDARITTSWLDMRQMLELGMPQPGKGRGKHSLGGERGRSSPLYSREDSSSPAAGSRYHSSSSLTSASASHSTSETDTESSVESGSYVPDSPPSVTKFQGVTRLEQSSRLSPVSTPIPPVLSPPKERSPNRNRKKSSSSPYNKRHNSQERSDSRTSSHSSKDREKDRETDRQREKALSPKYSTRLRSKRKLSDTDKGASTSTSTESPSRNTRSLRGYAPYSKRYRDDSSDSQSSKGDLKSSKTVFDRLGPTKEQADELDQIEKYGETDSKEKKPSGSSLLSPERKSGLKSPTSDEAKQSSGSSDKEVKKGSEKEEQDSTLRKAERGKDSQSTRGNRPKTRSQSDHRKPKSIQQAATESSTGDQETKQLPESTSMDTQVKDKATTSMTQDKQLESRTDTSVQEGQLNKEYPQEKAGKEKEDSRQLHHHSSPTVTEELDGEEAISRQQTEPSAPEHAAPSPDRIHSDGAGGDQQTSRQKTSAIDYKTMKESIMKVPRDY